MDGDTTHTDQQPDLAERLSFLERLERELIRKAAASVGMDADLRHGDFFMIGALRRTLAQSRGFRELIGSRNFPCAAAILRMQIDTAMRVNALRLLDDLDVACEAVLGGSRFNTLKDRDGNRCTDAYLRQKLSEDEPWVDTVYEQASDFVHLSGRHFYNSIAETDEETRTVRFVISDQDPSRPETSYFEIVDTFFKATKLVGLMTLAYFTTRYTPQEVGQGPDHQNV